MWYPSLLVYLSMGQNGDAVYAPGCAILFYEKPVAIDFQTQKGHAP